MAFTSAAGRVTVGPILQLLPLECINVLFSQTIAMEALNSRRKWSPEEDKDLRDLVMRYGTARGSQSRWKDIADHLTNRTPKVSIPIVATITYFE